MSAWTSPSAPRGAGAQSVPAFQPETGIDTDTAPGPSPGHATGRKVVALIPAGEVTGRDTVRWHNHDDPVRDQKDHYNSGDMFVYEASLRLLDFDSLEVVPLYSQLSDRDIDRLNAEASVCFLRGSNYLHNKMEWGNLPEVIDKLKLPVVAFGIGAQAPKYGEVTISDRTRRFMDVVSDRSEVIGVRGAFTAQVLADMGIKNVEAIGCPSLMRHNKPRLHMAWKPLDQVKKIGFTLTRGFWPEYCEDVAKSRALQRQLLVDLSKTRDLTVMSQGERAEKLYFYGTPEGKADAYAALVKEGWFQGPDDPLVQLYDKHMFFGRSPAEYEDLVRSLDMVLGFRLHGNIMGLANEVPAVYIVYDSRTRELVELFGIPSYDIMDKRPFALENHYTKEAYAHFEASYVRAYARMAAFLDKNGVAHRMRPEGMRPEGTRPEGK
jgi:hypothetical protein